MLLNTPNPEWRRSTGMRAKRNASLRPMVRTLVVLLAIPLLLSSCYYSGSRHGSPSYADGGGYTKPSYSYGGYGYRGGYDYGRRHGYGYRKH